LEAALREVNNENSSRKGKTKETEEA